MEMKRPSSGKVGFLRRAAGALMGISLGSVGMVLWFSFYFPMSRPEQPNPTKGFAYLLNEHK